VIGIGEPVPDATVWLDTGKQTTTGTLAREGSYLLLFYLFDWTGT
jgi:peroxiredoxin